MSEKKRALITGGASGIGKSVAMRLAGDGYKVCIFDRDDQKGIAALGQLKAAAEAYFIRYDVTDYDGARKAVDSAAELLGGIDLVVCCAHESCEMPVENITPEDWDRVVGTDLVGAFFPAQAAVSYLEKSGNGCIIHVSSIHGRIGSGAHAAYSAAMAGVSAMSRSLAYELAPKGIRCCAVSPYTVLTDSNRGRLDEPGWRELQEATVLNGGIMSPDEVADVIRYIASDDGRIFNACDIAVDGGMNMFRERPTVSAYK